VKAVKTFKYLNMNRISQRVFSGEELIVNHEKVRKNKTAERVGFEPTVTKLATTVFETAPIGRSGTSPCGGYYTLRMALCRGIFTSDSDNNHK
jgi:hypothetical protein